jgi:hypothetical protein
MPAPSQPLPPDFQATLARIGQLGITAEDAPKIQGRLFEAIHAAAEQAQARGDLAGDLGLGDWSEKAFHRCERAVHDQICDPSSGGLKEQYKNLLDRASSDDVINHVAVVITSALAPIFPTLVVSSVIVYFRSFEKRVGAPQNWPAPVH